MRFSSTNVQSLTSNPIVLNAKPTGRAVFHGTVRNMALYSNNMALYPIPELSLPISSTEMKIKVFLRIGRYLRQINRGLGSYGALRRFRLELVAMELHYNDKNWGDLYLDTLREDGFQNTDLARAIHEKLDRGFHSPLDQFALNVRGRDRSRPWTMFG